MKILFKKFTAIWLRYLPLLIVTVFAVSCSTSRKSVSTQEQTLLETAISDHSQVQSFTSCNTSTRTSEVDISTATIDFTRIEYTDGTNAIVTDSTGNNPTKPPHLINAVTYGRINFNADKSRTQEQTQSQEIASTSITDIEEKDVVHHNSTTDEKQAPSSNRFSLGLITGILIVVAIVILAIRLRRRFSGFIK